MDVRIVAAAKAAVNVVVKLFEDGLEGGMVSWGLNCGGLEGVEEVEVVVESRAEGEKVDAIGNNFGWMDQAGCLCVCGGCYHATIAKYSWPITEEICAMSC